jgi:hypothetical protein
VVVEGTAVEAEIIVAVRGTSATASGTVKSRKSWPSVVSNVDHSAIWRWVQRYAPELAYRQRAHLKPTNKSWRVDETYDGVKGESCYLNHAV